MISVQNSDALTLGEINRLKKWFYKSSNCVEQLTVIKEFLSIEWQIEILLCSKMRKAFLHSWSNRIVSTCKETTYKIWGECWDRWIICRNHYPWNSSFESLQEKLPLPALASWSVSKPKRIRDSINHHNSDSQQSLGGGIKPGDSGGGFC